MENGDVTNQNAAETHEASLKAELDSLRRINDVVHGLNASLDRARTNMTTVNGTVEQASSLLESWTRILGRTEHNQRLILNPAWNGASADVADAEAELRDRLLEKQRKEIEEQQRHREEAERTREEQKRADAISTAAGVRGRGRGVGTSRGGRGSIGTFNGSQSGTLGNTRGAAAAATTTGRAATARYGRVRPRGTHFSRGRGDTSDTTRRPY